jgi:putative NADH-flavin reductase
MKLVILGGAGRTGRELVGQALAAGHTVCAFIRTTEQAPQESPNLTIKIGDARSEADLTEALQGQEAVLSALGSNTPGDELIVRSTQALIAAAHATGVRRVLMMSSFLLTPNYHPHLLGRLAGMLMKGIVADKSSGEDLLKQSDLDWTIVYATLLNDGPKSGQARIVPEHETVGPTNGIARADVADFMLRQLQEASSIRQSLLITTK